MTPALHIDRKANKNTVRVFAHGNVDDMTPAKIQLHFRGKSARIFFIGRWMVQPESNLGTHYFDCDTWPRFFRQIPIKVEVVA